MSVFVFPGQGSQRKGMGAGLFDLFPALISQADNILGYSVKSLCLEDPENKLNQTQYTQPALYTVNVLTYYKKTLDAAMLPDYVAGHSLGEYNALLAAGVFDFATGLALVKKRGELMSQAQGGGMAAIIGLSADQIKSLLQENNLNDVVIANYNSFTQTVISGAKASVLSAQSIFEKSGGMVFPLNVSGAFHSPLMMRAQNVFAEFLSGFSFKTPTVPVLSNITAQPYDAFEINKKLAGQITGAVRWTEIIQYLLDKGEQNFEEVGPGQVLTGLIQRIKKGQ